MTRASSCSSRTRTAPRSRAGDHRGAYLVATRLGVSAEVRFSGDLATGTLIAEPVHAADWQRIAALVARYRDLRLGTVDASVVAAAKRLRIKTVATPDRRHFSVVRPDHVRELELLPQRRDPATARADRAPGP